MTPSNTLTVSRHGGTERESGECVYTGTPVHYEQTTREHVYDSGCRKALTTDMADDTVQRDTDAHPPADTRTDTGPRVADQRDPPDTHTVVGDAVSDGSVPASPPSEAAAEAAAEPAQASLALSAKDMAGTSK
jgi:hypothetical protein